MATLEIGDFSRRTVLTGAGWTRNWGGRLAKELWQDLIGHVEVQQNERLFKLLLEEQSYEAALERVRNEPYGHQDRSGLQRALTDAFISMDRELAQYGHHTRINSYLVQELLFRCWGLHGQRINAGYLFTLNQDLWPERYLYSSVTYGAPRPSLPGLKVGANVPLFMTTLGPYRDELIMQPVAEPAAHGSLIGSFNVIKLHGAFNWQSSGQDSVMIVGAGKDAQIGNSALLSWYFEIFKRVLSAGDVRLLIVGYSFADEHVNAAIATAVERHDLKVFIWDTNDDLVRSLKDKLNGPQILNGLLSTSSRPLSEVFPGNQVETGEYRRIRDTVFG